MVDKLGIGVFSPEEIEALIESRNDLLKTLTAVYEEAMDYHNSCGHGDWSAAECDAICDLLPAMAAAIAKAEKK